MLTSAGMPRPHASLRHADTPRRRCPAAAWPECSRIAGWRGIAQLPTTVIALDHRAPQVGRSSEARDRCEVAGRHRLAQPGGRDPLAVHHQLLDHANGEAIERPCSAMRSDRAASHHGPKALSGVITSARNRDRRRQVGEELLRRALHAAHRRSGSAARDPSRATRARCCTTVGGARRGDACARWITSSGCGSNTSATAAVPSSAARPPSRQQGLVPAVHAVENAHADRRGSDLGGRLAGGPFRASTAVTSSPSWRALSPAGAARPSRSQPRAAGRRCRAPRGARRSRQHRSHRPTEMREPMRKRRASASVRRTRGSGSRSATGSIASASRPASRSASSCSGVTASSTRSPAASVRRRASRYPPQASACPRSRAIERT